MNRNNAPDMSVVIMTPDHYHVIRKTIRYLRAQTVKARLEIIIGAPSRKDLDLVESDLAGFHSYKVVEVGEFRTLSHAKALAVRETSAPIVAFAEDHCFPESNWAEALITAHYQGHVADGRRSQSPIPLLRLVGQDSFYASVVVSGRRLPASVRVCLGTTPHICDISSSSMDRICRRCLSWTGYFSMIYVQKVIASILNQQRKLIM